MIGGWPAPISSRRPVPGRGTVSACSTWPSPESRRVCTPSPAASASRRLALHRSGPYGPGHADRAGTSGRSHPSAAHGHRDGDLHGRAVARRTPTGEGLRGWNDHLRRPFRRSCEVVGADQPRRTGSAARPRMRRVRRQARDSAGMARRVSGKRASSVRRVISVSARARGAPGQRWMPWPKRRWPVASRSSASGCRSRARTALPMEWEVVLCPATRRRPARETVSSRSSPPASQSRGRVWSRPAPGMSRAVSTRWVR